MPSNVVAIDDYNFTNPFQIIWNIGIRCNYDCSYCPSFRHSNTTPHNSFEKLKETVEIIKKYWGTMQQYIDPTFPLPLALNLTGGEPTSNPDILKLVEYLRQELGWNFKLAITSNGATNPELIKQLAPFLNTMTISFHAEASAATKKQVEENIFLLQKIGKSQEEKYNAFKGTSVNVMMHEEPQFFEECQELIKRLTAAGITARPRAIDRNDQVQSANRKEKKTRTITGSKMGPKTGLRYDDKQLNLLKDQFKAQVARETEKTENVKNEVETKTISIAKEKTSSEVKSRSCCSARTLAFATEENLEKIQDPKELNNREHWDPVMFLSDRNFKGWYCLVNYYWMEIEQDAGEFYHHQTCKARYNSHGYTDDDDIQRKKRRGPASSLSRIDEFLQDFKRSMDLGVAPVIQCPKERCACGICTPKSKDKQVITNMLHRIFPGFTPSFADDKINLTTMENERQEDEARKTAPKRIL